ncbi:MAG: FkbM family methyltransferase [Patescibacteria group bacterium]
MKTTYLIKRSLQLDLQFLFTTKLPLKAYKRLYITILKYFQITRDLLIKSKKLKSVRILGQKYYYDNLFAIGFIQSYFVDDSFLIDIIPKKSVIVDVGANIGQSNIFYYKFLKAKKVYSFEPIPDAYRALVKNSPKPKYCYNFAISKKEKMDIYMAAYSVGASSIKDGRLAKRIIKAKTKRLDEIPSIKKERRIGLLKIDVQGGEMDVVKASLETIKKTDFLLIEVGLSNESQNNLRELLNLVGDDFRIIKVPKINEFHQSIFSWQLDILFINKAILKDFTKKHKNSQFSTF